MKTRTDGVETNESSEIWQKREVDLGGVDRQDERDTDEKLETFSISVNYSEK